MTHIETTYGVVFQSKQSYYDLLHQAGLSWKKTQARRPQKDEAQVAQKTRDYGATREVALRDCQWTSAGIDAVKALKKHYYPTENS